MCFFPPFLGFVYTAIAGLLSDKMQSNEGSKHFTGRIKESQSFITTQLRLRKSYYSVSAILVFLYILTIFQCQFWSVFVFFFLFTVQVSKVLGVQALWKMLCLSPSVILLASAMTFTDVFLSLPSCRESLFVHILRPSLSPKRALLCFSVTPSRSSLLSLFKYHASKVTYHVANFVFHPFPKHFWHKLSLYCTEAVPTQQFYMQQKQCNTQAKHSL